MKGFIHFLYYEDLAHYISGDDMLELVIPILSIISITECKRQERTLSRVSYKELDKIIEVYAEARVGQLYSLIKENN